MKRHGRWLRMLISSALRGVMRLREPGEGMFERHPFFRDAKATIWERISSGFAPLSSRCPNAPHNSPCHVRRDRAVARESSQSAFVLAPNLEVLRRKLELIGDLDQRVAETVRVGARKPTAVKASLCE